MPSPDLTADPNQPRAQAAERIAAACRELHAAHLLTGWFDERGYWFPFAPGAGATVEWTRISTSGAAGNAGPAG